MFKVLYFLISYNSYSKDAVLIFSFSQDIDHKEASEFSGRVMNLLQISELFQNVVLV